MKNERELLSRSKIIYDLTKEIVENETKANKRFYNWAYHETWMLQDFPKTLASKKAYELFYNKYKKDIRNCDWFNKEISESRDDKNRRLFMHEHLTTSEDFKQELIYLYKQNKLSVEKVKDLILQQRVCWITREEDDLLRKKYKSHRPNPLHSYKECGIEIYDEENEDLSNIMIPTFTIEKSLPNMPFIENISHTIMENIKTSIMQKFPNFYAHYSPSYIQIWKKTWNNQGKRGVHFELSPQKSKGFNDILGKDQFTISFKFHNENNTPNLPKTKVYFRREYSFLEKSIQNSIELLLNDIQKIINTDELNIDEAHKRLS